MMRFWLKLLVVTGLVLFSGGPWAKSVAVARGRGHQGRGAPRQDRTDAELMLDAVNKWRGESPDAAKIERISAEARAESKRKQVVWSTASTTWKDPFADDPDRAIPVRRTMSKTKGLATVRRELARARAETAAAQADAAKAKATMAKVQAAAAWTQAVAAKHEAEAARAACVDPGSRRHEARAQDSPPRGRADSFAPKRHARAAHPKDRGLASNADSRQAPSVDVPAEPPPPEEVAPEPSAAPLALTSPRSGILVVPITR